MVKLGGLEVFGRSRYLWAEVYSSGLVITRASIIIMEWHQLLQVCWVFRYDY